MKTHTTPSRRIQSERAGFRSPDALVKRAQLCHQFRGPFVLVTAQVVNGLHGFGRGLQLILVDAHALVLRTHMRARESRWRAWLCRGVGGDLLLATSPRRPLPIPGVTSQLSHRTPRSAGFQKQAKEAGPGAEGDLLGFSGGTFCSGLNTCYRRCAHFLEN